MRRLWPVIGPVLILLAATAGGCIVTRRTYEERLKELLEAKHEIERLEKREKELLGRIENRDRQIQTLQTLGEKRFEKLFQVARIEIEQYTRGVDLDDEPGHDGVRIYVLPVDEDGSTIKAAGSFVVELYDLKADPAANRVGRREWTVDEASKRWTSFILSHYSLTCPWQDAPPKHEEITVRVMFTDYLTGREFSEQFVIKVELAPNEATTKPAAE